MTPDPAELAHIHAAATARTGAQAWTAAAFAGLLQDRHVFVCSAPNSFALGRAVAGEAELLLIATHPAHQRQGSARRALAAFEDQAAARGAERAFLEVAVGNAAALALYSSAGWTEDGVRKGYYQRSDGTREDARLLSKALCP